ncbi:hypothetical protein [Kitasatospora purpeofusca]|uniref:hypothetical protein n=1 Tax=Kitasatospora purpeofusca TaxID=67352 RepID=UPI0004BE50FD|nr:hypothetical protein [Kitasatospora purpeofusca]
MATQRYHSQINLEVPGRDGLAVIYADTTDQPGLTAEQVAGKAARAALAEVPNGKVVGYHVGTDGIVQ